MPIPLTITLNTFPSTSHGAIYSVTSFKSSFRFLSSPFFSWSYGFWWSESFNLRKLIIISVHDFIGSIPIRDHHDVSRWSDFLHSLDYFSSVHAYLNNEINLLLAFQIEKLRYQIFCHVFRHQSRFVNLDICMPHEICQGSHCLPRIIGPD